MLYALAGVSICMQADCFIKSSIWSKLPIVVLTSSSTPKRHAIVVDVEVRFGEIGHADHVTQSPKHAAGLLTNAEIHGRGIQDEAARNKVAPRAALTRTRCPSQVSLISSGPY